MGNNEICDRLCEAAMLADRNEITITLNSLGFVVYQGGGKMRLVTYLEMSGSKLEILYHTVEAIIREA